jgi:predicted kinase
MRNMLHDGWLGTDEQEHQITVAAQEAVAGLLRAGYDVVCDDTNLMPEHIVLLRQVAAACAANFEVWDMTDVPVEVCVQRDEERGLDGGHYIGDAQIHRMHSEFLRRTTTPLVGRTP